MTSTTDAPEDRPSTAEMSESLTGWDEIAVEKHMGIDPYTDGERKPMLLMRSLVFVHKTRQGLSGPDARQAVMDMPVSALNDYFSATEPELPDTDPETPAGNDEPTPEPVPTS